VTASWLRSPVTPSQRFVIDGARPLPPLPRSVGVATCATRRGTLSPLSGQGLPLPQLLDGEASTRDDLLPDRTTSARASPNYTRKQAIWGASMLQFMDWSVVAMGCLLVLVALGGRWWERAEARKGAGPVRGARFFWAWLPLLLGLGMIGGNLPRLLHASYAVVMTMDTLNLVLAVTTVVLVLRAARHFFRGRGLRTLE